MNALAERIAWPALFHPTKSTFGTAEVKKRWMARSVLGRVAGVERTPGRGAGQGVTEGGGIERARAWKEECGTRCGDREKRASAKWMGTVNRVQARKE